jgi:hypothetical protein
MLIVDQGRLSTRCGPPGVSEADIRGITHRSGHMQWRQCSTFVDFLAERLGPEPYWDLDVKQKKGMLSRAPRF